MMTNRVALGLVLVAVLLTSCGPSPEQIQTAIAATQAAIPTATVEPTATPKPITGADLEPLFLQPGDLPSEYSLGQYLMDPPEEWLKPDIYRGVGIDIADADAIAAYVNVGIYSDTIDADGFEWIAYFHGDPVEGLGDFSRYMDERIDIVYVIKGVLAYDVKVAWTRCHYAALVTFQSGMRSGGAITYARRLDERLAKVLCP